MATQITEYEEALPVALFGWNPSSIQVQQEVQSTLDRAGALELQVKSTEFQEYDSNNPHHACGYWLITLEGPQDAVDRLSTYLDD